MPDLGSLNRLAYSQEGYFTVGQARERGLSAQLLAHHVRARHFERIQRGLYRLRDYPVSEHDEIRAKWLAVGSARAIVSHESALEVLGLSDVLPNRVHLLVDRKERGLRPPAGVVLHTTSMPLGPGDVVTRAGLKVTGSVRSIVDSTAFGTAPEQIEAAVRQAIESGEASPESLLRAAERRGRRVAHLIGSAMEDLASR